jgi:hypothetical protein
VSNHYKDSTAFRGSIVSPRAGSEAVTPAAAARVESGRVAWHYGHRNPALQSDHGVNPMDSGNTAELRDQLLQLGGALDIIVILREEMQQWLEEAQDDSKREALENVVGHLQAVEEEYKHRGAALRKKLAP